MNEMNRLINARIRKLVFNVIAEDERLNLIKKYLNGDVELSSLGNITLVNKVCEEACLLVERSECNHDELDRFLKYVYICLINVKYDSFTTKYKKLNYVQAFKDLGIYQIRNRHLYSNKNISP